MARQHVTPLLLQSGHPGAIPLVAVGPQAGEGSIDEAFIQALVHAHPAALPIAEIDPIFAGAIPICRELNTTAGPIDNFLITASGLPVLVECKLWRNPEGRREVVGTAQFVQTDGRPRIIDSFKAGTLDDPEVRRRAFGWLAERVNTFINVLRPRVRSAVADFQARDERPT